MLQSDRETCCFAGQALLDGRCTGNRTCPAGLEPAGDQCLRVEQHASVHISGPIVLGVGAAIAVGGALLWMNGEQLTSALREECATMCPSDWPSRAEAIRRSDLATNVLLWGGGAVSITGAVLTAVVRNRWETRTAVSIALTPTGVFAVGRF